MAFTVDHAKRMRAAFRRTPGNTPCRSATSGLPTGAVPDAHEFSTSRELMGKITAIHAHMYRNTPHGKPQWSRPVYPDMTPENIIWKSFLGERRSRSISTPTATSTGASSGTTRAATSMRICATSFPSGTKCWTSRFRASVTMVGGIYLWKDGREVPDTMNVSMEHEEEILFTWDSGFGNDQLGVTEDVLGDNGTISHTPQTIKYYPQKVNRKDGNEMTRHHAQRPQGAHAELL